MITEKVWGTTECVLATPLIEIHRLKIKPKFQCSLHTHKRKWNAFIVISGELEIIEAKADHVPPDKTILHPGDFLMAPPGEHHRFRTGILPCEAYEIYYPDALSEDIERKDTGGPATDD